jgi:alpha-L-fucosidase
MTMNDTWGFKSYDENWKSSETLVRQLIDSASKGGNYLLNVGPTAEGEIPAPSVERLAAVGKWMRMNGDSIYGTTASPFSNPLAFGRATRKGQTIYLHVFDWPENGTLAVPALSETLTSATLLGRADAKVDVNRTSTGFELKLPPQPADRAATVIVAKLGK